YFLVHLSPISTIFPYTTLFRSVRDTFGTRVAHRRCCPMFEGTRFSAQTVKRKDFTKSLKGEDIGVEKKKVVVKSSRFCRVHRVRSEEHTSELQSRENLVCRLLL